MTGGWVQEVDDVPWSEFMRWSADQDIVPFRPEESVSWRVFEIRWALASLNRQWDTVCRDGRIRLREFERERGLSLSWAWEDPPPAERIGAASVREAAALGRAAAAGAEQSARSLLDALRDVDPALPDDYLDAVPSVMIDAIEQGESARVQLQGGQEVQVRSRNGRLEAYVAENRWDGWPWEDAPADPGADPVLGRREFVVEFPVDPDAAAWFQSLMDSLLSPTPPLPDTFLAAVREQQERRDREAGIPGIQSESWRNAAWDPANTFPGISPWRQRLQETPGGHGFMSSPPPFAPDGTYVGPGQDTQGGRIDPLSYPGGHGQTVQDYVRRIVSANPAQEDAGVTAWIVPLDADGQPTGHPMCLPGVSVRWQADADSGGQRDPLADTDVRGGHM